MNRLCAIAAHIIFAQSSIRAYITAIMLLLSGTTLAQNSTSSSDSSYYCKLKNTFSSAGQTLSYYFSKLPEATQLLNYNDMKMIKVGLAAQANKKNSRMETVTLGQIKLFHPISTKEAMAKTEKRSKVIREKMEELMKQQPLSSQKIDELIPSIDPIQLVVLESDPDKGNTYLVIQGQGRLQSMKVVLPADFQIKVEVSDLDQNFKDDLKVVRNNYIKSGYKLDY